MNLKNKLKIYFLLTIVLISIVTAYAINKRAKKAQILKAQMEHQIKAQEEIKQKELVELNFKNAIEESSKIPASHWEKNFKNISIKDKYRVAIVTTAGGEHNYAEYFKYVAEKKGWNAKIYLYKIDNNSEFLDFDPDFILFTTFAERNLSPEVYSHRSKKYLINLAPLEQVRDSNWIEQDPDNYGKSIDFIRPFHAIISIPKDMGYLENISNKAGKYFYGIGIIPAAPALINEPVDPKTLMWSGMGWGLRYAKEEHQKFVKLLSENVPIKLYGKFLSFNYLNPKLYDGFIPSNGIEYINAIRRNGIYFLTHNQFHLESGVPSLRIFEAIASNSIVISDKHPFAVENFGDSFLYYDHDASAEVMYAQVKSHIDWILANPEKAKAMAAKAHQIFLEKFTLDKDLDRIAKLHEYVLQQENKMNLSYPLEY